jgi:hypothetical protein
MIMKDIMLLNWYWLEIKYSQLLCLFGVRRSTKPIPKGMYCYEHTGHRYTNTKGESIIKIRTCPYYRWTKRTKKTACTYSAFYGFDFGLYDQCKICGEKDDITE